MGADIKHQVTRLYELAVEAVHRRRARAVTVVDTQGADDTARSPEALKHRVRPRLDANLPAKLNSPCRSREASKRVMQGEAPSLPAICRDPDAPIKRPARAKP